MFAYTHYLKYILLHCGITLTCGRMRIYMYKYMACNVIIRYTSKRMQQFVKFVCHVLIKSRATLYGLPLDLCGKRRIRNCGTFCQTRRNFCQTRRNLVNTPHFRGKKRRNPCFTGQRTAARTRWEISGAHGAAFSRVATAHLLQSF